MIVRDFYVCGEVIIEDSEIERIIEEAGRDCEWSAGGVGDSENRTFTTTLDPRCPDVRGRREFAVSYDRIADAFMTLATEPDPRPELVRTLHLLAAGERWNPYLGLDDYDCIIQQALFGQVVFG